MDELFSKHELFFYPSLARDLVLIGLVDLKTKISFDFSLSVSVG